jgi:hypothetical protein
VREHYAHVIGDRKLPQKRRPVIAHIKERSKYYKKKALIRPNLACRRVPSSVCGVPVFINAGFIASGWVWHYEPVLRAWSERLGFGNGCVCLRFGVIFEHRLVWGCGSTAVKEMCVFWPVWFKWDCF